MLIATGLDPDRSTIFAQSHVTAHAEAAWLLGAVTSYGQLGRMTQFKEKGGQQGFVSAALFNYPVLMAGDILLYRADGVPIGDDQRQHLELARDIAERFNSRFGRDVRRARGDLPRDRRADHGPAGPAREDGQDRLERAGHDPDARRARRDPAQAEDGRHRLRAPRCGAATDKPGVSNLIDILSVATGETPEQIESRYDGAGYGQLKADVAEAVIAVLEPIQERYRELRADETELRRLLAHGAEKARVTAAPLLEQMYERMGFVRL